MTVCRTSLITRCLNLYVNRARLVLALLKQSRPPHDWGGRRGFAKQVRDTYIKNLSVQ
jgi:hypothetical protein